MLIDLLLDLIEGLILLIASAFPSWDFPAVFDNWSLVTGNLAALNYYLPISEVFALVLSVFYVLPLFLGTTVVLWVVGFIRGGSSRA